MNHPPTVILDRWPNGSVIRVEPERRPLWLPFCRVGGVALFLALLVWSPKTYLTLSAGLAIAMLGARWLKRAAAKYTEPCSHAADSTHGLEDVAEGYAVLRCRCDQHRRIVRVR